MTDRQKDAVDRLIREINEDIRAAQNMMRDWEQKRENAPEGTFHNMIKYWHDLHARLDTLETVECLIEDSEAAERINRLIGRLDYAVRDLTYRIADLTHDIAMNKFF